MNLIFFVSFIIASQAVDYEEEWNLFKARFQPKYVTKLRNGFEEIKRFGIFRSNLNFILKHNKEADEGNHTFRLGVNQFADMTNAEFQRWLNLSREAKPKLNPKFRKLNFQPVPVSFDWRTANIVTPVKSQGKCGSCWAFSAVAAIESAYAQKTNKLLDLSEQSLVDCDTLNSGCNGGIVDRAFKSIKTKPIMLEADYPYNATKGTCKYDRTKTRVSVPTYYTVRSGDETALKFAVARQPTCVGIAVTKFFQFYMTGVLNDNSCGNKRSDQNHAVLAVGYGTDPIGGDFWHIKNSWGTSWGQQGFAQMSRNKNNQCGIATWASYPIL